MIQYKTGDLLDNTYGVIIHGCNAKGVMGSGVALAIKVKYPKAYEAYKRFEERHGLRLASISTAKVSETLEIANLVSQENYGRDPDTVYVSYGSIHLGFEKLHGVIPKHIPFHFPKIGAGLANGDWDTIAPLIELACPDRTLICWCL